MNTIEEIKEFANKCCKSRGYIYKNETIPYTDGFFEGFQKAVEEYEKQNKEKEDGREIETYK